MTIFEVAKKAIENAEVIDGDSLPFAQATATLAVADALYEINNTLGTLVEKVDEIDEELIVTYSNLKRIAEAIDIKSEPQS